MAQRLEFRRGFWPAGQTITLTSGELMITTDIIIDNSDFVL